MYKRENWEKLIVVAIHRAKRQPAPKRRITQLSPSHPQLGALYLGIGIYQTASLGRARWGGSQKDLLCLPRPTGPSLHLHLGQGFKSPSGHQILISEIASTSGEKTPNRLYSAASASACGFSGHGGPEMKSEANHSVVSPGSLRMMDLAYQPPSGF